MIFPMIIINKYKLNLHISFLLGFFLFLVDSTLGNYTAPGIKHKISTRGTFYSQNPI